VVFDNQFTSVVGSTLALSDNFYQSLYDRAKWLYSSEIDASVEDYYTFDNYWMDPPLSSKKCKTHHISPPGDLSNLTPIQARALKSLKANKNIFIKPTDKNLGPAAMDLDSYIQQVLREHLLTNDYIQLTKDSALNRMENIKKIPSQK
jgi:hypothetical protein